MAPPRKTLAEYEAEAVRVGACLLSPGSTSRARRVYILRHGPLRTEQYVCHTCDTPRCIEDAHHFLGSCLDNVKDAVAKGRHSCFQGNRRGKPARHSEETKAIIGVASKRMWEKRRAQMS